MKKVNNLLSYKEYKKLWDNNKKTKRTGVGGDVLNENWKKPINAGGRIITVVNPEGGVGKTTIAMMLANAFKRKGKDVLYVDASDKFSYFGVGDKYQTEEGEEIDLAFKGPSSGEVKTDYMKFTLTDADAGEGATSLGVPLGAGFKGQLLGETDIEYRLKNELAKLDKKYDFIIIDTPSGLDENQIMVFNAMAAADTMLVPLQAHYNSLKNMTHVFNTIKLVQTRLNPDIEFDGLIINKVENTPESQKAVAEIRQHFQDLLIEGGLKRQAPYINSPGTPTKEFMDQVAEDLLY